MKTLGRPPLRHRRRRAWRRVLLGLLVVVLAGAGGVVFYGRDIAAHVIREGLERAGLPPDRVEVRRLGLTGLELGPMQLGGADGPAVSAIEAGWGLPSLLRGRLAFLRIEGLTAHARVDSGELVVQGLPRSHGSGGAVALPIDRLELARAQVDLIAGDIKIVADANATLSGSASDIRGEANIDARVTGAGPEPLQIVAKLPQWHVRLRADGIDAAIVQASVALPDHSVELASIDANAITGAAMTVKLSGELHDRAPNIRLAPLQIALDGRRDKDAIVMAGTVASRDKALDIKLAGRHTLADNQGTLAVEAAPLRFAADGAQPADLAPMIGDVLRRVSGVVTARGQVGWGAGLTSKADIALQDFGFETGVIRLADLDGKLALTAVTPPRTAGPQHFTAKLHVAGLPDGAIDLRFTLPGNDSLKIDKASFAIAGSTLELVNITLGRGRPVVAELAIRGLDLATMLGLIDVDGLSGSGIIAGRIPVRVDDSGVAILSGRLGATGSGIVRYTGKALPDTGGGGPNDSVRLMRQALTDFHYTDMTLTLDREVNGDGSLLVNLKGSNPAVLENHPFVFNIKLETNFDKLAAILLSGYAAAEGLMRGAVKP